MNKNKIILLVGVIIFTLFIVFLLQVLWWGDKKTTPTTGSASGGFNIWTYGDDATGLSSVLESFKKTYPQYQSVIFNVENFSDYETYTLALASAISKNKTPDIFVVNNNESSLYSDQVIAIPNTIINPSDFRKKYKAVFWEDLIITFEDESEFVTGVPIGYETLWIYYNRKFVKSTQLSSQAALSSVVSEINGKDDEKIGIALWNGSTVVDSGDIITQYFMLDGDVDSIDDLDEKNIKTALETYFRYGSDGWDNGYGSDVFVELKSTGQNNLDLFSRGDVVMVAGYPRMLSDIADKWYSKKFLLASPFPHYAWESGKSLVNYNSFVINKDSLQSSMAYELLAYFTSEGAVEQYLESYPYYLPWLLSLESQALSSKIDDSFNITLWDFYNSEYELSSFDKGIKWYYDREIIDILDDSPNYNILFSQFKDRILCQSKKILSLENLSVACE